MLVLASTQCLAATKTPKDSICSPDGSRDVVAIYDNQVAKSGSNVSNRLISLEGMGFSCERTHNLNAVNKNAKSYSCKIFCVCSFFGKSKEIPIGVNAFVAGGDPKFNYSKNAPEDSVIIMKSFRRCD